MKITRCVFLLCITAVGVFGQPKQLYGIVKKSVKFPTAVEDGNLKNKGRIIASVRKSALTKSYDSRVEWDRSTGYFSLSTLMLNDSGVYTVTYGVEQLVEYNLKVYEGNVPVSTPNVRVLRDQYPCILLCAVDRGTEATLSWYREGEATPYVNSSVGSAPGLDMPVPVEKGGIYTCVAKNSVGNKTSDPLTVGDNCTGGAAGRWQTEGCRMWILCLVLFMMLHSLLV